MYIDREITQDSSLPDERTAVDKYRTRIAFTLNGSGTREEKPTTIAAHPIYGQVVPQYNIACITVFNVDARYGYVSIDNALVVLPSEEIHRVTFTGYVTC